MDSKYQINISDSLEDPEWDMYVAKQSGGHHAQTSGWARVKAYLGWKVNRIVIYNEGLIVGGAQILIKSLPIVGNVGYVTKAPYYDAEQPDLGEMIFDQILKTCDQKNCQLIAIQPPNNDTHITKHLESSGFSPSSLELAPTATLLIDLKSGQDVILKQMSKKVRQHIHRSVRSGIIVTEGNQSDLDIFYSCYLKTAQRQGFSPYKREYFDILWETFSKHGWISLMIARYQDEPVSAQLLIPFGDMVIAKMMGWTGEYHSFRPNEALYDASIQWSIEHGYSYFDFEGINPNKAREILNGQTPDLLEDTFKFGFGGKVILYPPAYDLLPNKIYNFVYRLNPPEIDGDSFLSHLVEFVRKR